MTPKKIDLKLMRLLYFLATKQKKMNSMETHKELMKEGWRLSDRTIRRWFKSLNDKRDINYFFNLKSESFGVIRTYVLLKGLKNDELTRIIPFLIYNVKGVSMGSLEPVQLVQYDVPAKNMKEFGNFWETAKKSGLISHFKILPHKPSTVFYAPFHEIIDRNGHIEFRDDISNSDYFMNLFKESVYENTRLSPLIVKHPIIIPLLYSSFGENFSSKRIWMSLKKHSGQIWNFIPAKLTRKGRKEGVVIRYIHDVLKMIEENRNNLFQQIRVSYKHFYQGHYNTFYLIFRAKNDKQLTNLIEELHKRTLQLNFTKFYEKRTCMFYIVTNDKKFLEIMHDVLPRYIDYNYSNQLILQESDPEKNYYGKIDWTRFDPIKREWSYEQGRYMQLLNKFA